MPYRLQVSRSWVQGQGHKSLTKYMYTQAGGGPLSERHFVVINSYFHNLKAGEKEDLDDAIEVI